jgi:hypothetical protein
VHTAQNVNKGRGFLKEISRRRRRRLATAFFDSFD